MNNRTSIFYPSSILKVRIENAIIENKFIKASLLTFNGRVIFLNKTAFEVIKLLNRSKSIEEVVESLASRYGERKDVIRRDVEEFVRRGMREGLIAPERSSRIEVPKEEPECVKDYLRSPADLYVEVTSKCNLRCIHCYSGSSPSGGHIQREFLDELAREASEMSVHRVLIGGGEPLMHEDIVEIISSFARNKILPLLSTNGFFFDESLGKELFRAGLRIIQFNLDGLKDTHERIRGLPGIFPRVIEGIMTAKNLGYIVYVKCVAMGLNLKEIPRVYELARELGADFFVLNRAIPCGRARDNWRVVGVKYSELKGVINELRAIEGPPTRLLVEERDVEGLVSRPLSSTGSCNAGKTLVGVSSSLSIKPCLYFPDSISCGRLFKEWGKLEAAWHSCEILKIMRSLKVSDLHEPCRSCRRCHGGCRAAALLLYGDLRGPDPLCPVVEGGAGAGS